jgi:type I restriction enzyme S subunit
VAIVNGFYAFFESTVLPNSKNYFDKFLIICLQPYLNAINSETSAVTVKHLSSRSIQQIPLPLPPLPEQRAIVSKIEQLFSDLDNGIENFKKAQARLKLCRQSVLKAASEGNLVPTAAENLRAQRGVTTRLRMCYWRAS